MERRRGIWTPASFAIGQYLLAGKPAFTIDRRSDAKARQHALDGLQSVQIDLREPDGYALGLRALHGAVGIEQPAQETAIKLRRTALDLWCNALCPGTHAKLDRERPQRTERQTKMARLARHFGLPALE